jgi:hypothetical protein
MRTVWKYPVAISDKPTVHAIPHNDVIVHVALQEGLPTLWAIVESDQETEERTFVVTGTGHPVPEDASYIGTVMEPLLRLAHLGGPTRTRSTGRMVLPRPAVHLGLTTNQATRRLR